jgi:UDP-N-acetylmuramyl pentapeptide phosphotransferase/UDP-N-acetylglucosamine-1-phosphate transferase
LAVLGWQANDHVFTSLNLITVGAAVGFLHFNFPPARIFMGDTGSSALGFLAAGISLWGDMTGTVPLWVSVLVFSPFIADATFTLLRRVRQREKVWEAHKTHYYQRLVQSGWGHRKTVMLEYGLMAACSAAALAARTAPVAMQWTIITSIVFLYIGYFLLVRFAEINKKKSPGS